MYTGRARPGANLAGAFKTGGRVLSPAEVLRWEVLIQSGAGLSWKALGGIHYRGHREAQNQTG
jgi:hypothetical protein